MRIHTPSPSPSVSPSGGAFRPAPLALLLLLWLVLLIPVLPGCTSSAGGPRGGGGNTGGSSGRAIGEVHLFGLPAALTTPGSSLPSGVGVRIYACEPGGARGLPLAQGELDVLLFDRTATDLDPQAAKPLKIWTLHPQDLEPFRTETMMGTGYQLELRWNQDRPKSRVFSVVARYRKRGKQDIYSSPAVIVAAPR